MQWCSQPQQSATVPMTPLRSQHHIALAQRVTAGTKVPTPTAPTQHHASCSSRRWRHLIRSARHPELRRRAPGSGMERPDVEADPHYRRLDYSTELAADARAAFAQQLAAGQAGVHLARAALLVAAEDDAIASHTTVPFPVDAFLQRIRTVAQDINRLYLTPQQQQQQDLGSSSTNSSSSSSSSGSSSGSSTQLTPQQVVAVVQHHLFGVGNTPTTTTSTSTSTSSRSEGVASSAAATEPPAPQPSPSTTPPPTAAAAARPASQQLARGLQLQASPGWCRSGLPRRSLLDHPGVWEDARGGYLHEVLVRRKGHPAALAIILAEVMQQLLLMGAIDFAVQLDTRDYSAPPVAVPLPNLSRALVLLPGGDGVLNTCSWVALEEVLLLLKRAYWPWPWDSGVDVGRGSRGGFRGAVKAALSSQEVSAALRAVSATAAHRLQRGIWTSPGAGDLRRARAAAERLVMLVGEEHPEERCDLAIVLLHCGCPEQAAAELAAYRATPAARQADPFDGRLVEQLWELLEPIRAAGALPPPVSVRAVLEQHEARLKGGGAPLQQDVLPLTW